VANRVRRVAEDWGTINKEEIQSRRPRGGTICTCKNAEVFSANAQVFDSYAQVFDSFAQVFDANAQVFQESSAQTRKFSIHLRKFGAEAVQK
jgi:hypothetical protein